MSKIPKEIVDKIEQRNKLNEEIEIWCKENLDMDGMCSDDADITDHHTGNEQSTVGGRESLEPESIENFMQELAFNVDNAERLLEDIEMLEKVLL